MKLRVFYETGWEISRALGPTRENVKLTKIFQVTVALQFLQNYDQTFSINGIGNFI